MNASVENAGRTLSATLTSTIPSGKAHSGLNLFSGKSVVTSTGSIDPSVFSLWENQPGNVVKLSLSNGNPTFKGTDVGGDNLLFGGKIKGTDKGDGRIHLPLLGRPVGPAPLDPGAGRQYLSAIVAFAMTLMLIGRRSMRRSS